VSSSLDVVRRFLHDRFGSHPLRLEALSTQDITDFMVRQHRQYSLPSKPGQGILASSGD